jgi:hypothetical protein
MKDEGGRMTWLISFAGIAGGYPSSFILHPSSFILACSSFILV